MSVLPGMTIFGSLLLLLLILVESAPPTSAAIPKLGESITVHSCIECETAKVNTLNVAKIKRKVKILYLGRSNPTTRNKAALCSLSGL